MHQLCGAVDVAALAAAAPTTHAGVSGGNDLDARVRVLEDQVAQLQEQLALLQERLQGTV